MTKIGFKLTISPFDYQIFTAPLTEPLRVDYLCTVATKVKLFERCIAGTIVWDLWSIATDHFSSHQLIMNLFEKCAWSLSRNTQYCARLYDSAVASLPLSTPELYKWLCSDVFGSVFYGIARRKSFFTAIDPDQVTTKHIPNRYILKMVAHYLLM